MVLEIWAPASVTKGDNGQQQTRYSGIWGCLPRGDSASFATSSGNTIRPFIGREELGKWKMVFIAPSSARPTGKQWKRCVRHGTYGEMAGQEGDSATRAHAARVNSVPNKFCLHNQEVRVSIDTGSKVHLTWRSPRGCCSWLLAFMPVLQQWSHPERRFTCLGMYEGGEITQGRSENNY